MAASTPIVDVVVLTRDSSPLRAEVQRGIDSQRGVRVRLHRVIGEPRPEDPNRWATIARARNLARSQGRSRWAMFLDDDVQLDPDCLRTLVTWLMSRPTYGAAAANYLGLQGRLHNTPHVAMAATLFRRHVLQRLTFRWKLGRCECQCCCDDLRAMGLGITYLPTAKARHLHRPQAGNAGSQPATQPPILAGRSGAYPTPCILTAFNRRHYDKFRQQFLRSLRGAGNRERVIVVGYGLYPSERRALAQMAGVEVIHQPVNGTMPPVRRLRDLQPIVAALPPDTPVAYWDAGDVVFQNRLTDLWQTAVEHPEKLLAVREPKGHPQNRAVAAWTLSIRDAPSRRRAFDLLARSPFLNSGFAAGTARTMLCYLREADRLRHSKELKGSSDWGDQTALNLYCHSQPDAWMEVAEGWNYCLLDRQWGEVYARRDGRLISRKGSPIHVAHGNARSLRKLAFWRPF
jgi:hypothetical protein